VVWLGWTDIILIMWCLSWVVVVFLLKYEFELFFEVN